MSTQKRIKIGFLASGEIGIRVLSALMQAKDEIEICFVNTQMDRPSGRKQQLQQTPIGEFATQSQLPLYKYNVSSELFNELMHKTEVDLIVVIDFGQILRSNVLDYPIYGCLNIHASLLPQYRGASPIQSAILNGDEFTGVSFMKMDKGLDTGDVYMSFVLPISPNMQAPQLLSSLSELSAKHVVKMIHMIVAKRVTPIQQDSANANVCRKITKENGYADFNDPARVLCAKVNAFHPWPGVIIALTSADKMIRVRVTSATRLDAEMPAPAGTLLDCGKKRIVIACSLGAIEILRLVPESKKEMSAAEFLNGFPLQPGVIIAPIAKN